MLLQISVKPDLGQSTFSNSVDIGRKHEYFSQHRLGFPDGLYTRNMDATPLQVFL